MESGGRGAKLETRNSRRSVELRIEELVLHGFAPQDCSRIAQAVERELTRLLLAEGGLPPSVAQSGGLFHLDGGDFEITPGSSADAIGAQVAQTLYGGLNR